MLHKKIIFIIVSLIWGLVLILGVNITLHDAVSIEDQITNQVQQNEIVNAYNAEIERCDTQFTYNSSNWSQCLQNALDYFEINLLDEEHYQKLRNNPEILNSDS